MFLAKKNEKHLWVKKKVPTFATAFEKQASVKRGDLEKKDGAIVYRLGREIFIL